MNLRNGLDWGGGVYNILVMMSNNFKTQSAKTVWRNIAVAVFALCFALLGLGVTVLPTKAADEEASVITNPVLLGTVELGEYPQSYVGNTLNETLKKLNDSYRTGKTYTGTDDGKTNLNFMNTLMLINYMLKFPLCS